ncbi:xanthine dehydrogenase family protein molybdopterin-binding subunit [Microbulbifer hainanensis]|uniref:xanthine dehydrogenase family protein molybdopterin-binding subunit n=1 Tax=Microbulbifer hainanensis TaxID=2735675 RepID=UPI00186926F0|nr:molybdopterin cofactor-binding domain-containing protein [Microbulbifer hainanensis]
MSRDEIDIKSPSRRDFLGVSLAAASGLLIGFSVGGRVWAQEVPATPPASVPKPKPNAFVRIDASGPITLVLPYVEMGQGVYTSQVQLLAEELEVEPASVSFEAAPPNNELYANPFIGEQVTGGSTALRGSWITLRQAGAAAREMLIEAAARRWNVPASACHAMDGRVIEAASGRSIEYGQVARDAAKLPIPTSPVLKTPDKFRFVGKSTKRVDSPAKTNGSAIFGIDVRPPGLRYAVVSACPVFNGKLASVDDSKAMKIRGVQQIVKTDDAVAVVADNTWGARKGLAALKIRWDEGANATLTTADLVHEADTALRRKGLIFTKEGDVAKAEARAAKRYEADFRQPILAHAAMEPLSCTVHVKADSCEVWLGSQNLARAHKAAAKAVGLPPDKVTMHNYYLGGGFGRRLEIDYVPQAVLIAKQVEGPVKVTWTREEDMQHDYYRYLNNSRVTVGLDSAGKPISWRHRVIGPNVMERFLPGNTKDGIDLDVVECAQGPYDIPNTLIEYTRNEPPKGLGAGNWRGVGPTRNVFVVESVIEELALQSGKDPLAYRLPMMNKHPRPKAALELAANKAGWGHPLPKGSGRGIAVFSGFGSHLALVAQVDVSSSGRVRVKKVVCAVDTGFVVNPDVVRAQMEGGIIFGITAALYGKITVKGGRIVESNFDTYPMLRMREAPEIEVYIIDSKEDSGGVGEPGTTGAIAAVSNAVSAATGKRIMTLPIEVAKGEEG